MPDDSPGWYDNAERMYYATLKFLVKMKLLIYVGGFATIAYLGYKYDVPILQDAVEAMLSILGALGGSLS